MTSGFRVVHVLAPGHFGGLERVVEMLAAGQAQAGHQVAAVLSLGSGGEDHPLTALLRAQGITVMEIRLGSRAYVEERRQLRTFLASFLPNVVHTHGYRTDVTAGNVARSLGLATVSTAHGFTGGGWRNNLYEWMQRRAWRRYSAVVAVSRPLVARMTQAGVDARRIECVPNAWSSETAPLDRRAARIELGLAPDALVVGWVGRFSREKGADVMLEAFARVRNPAIRLALVGAGSEEPALRDLARQLNIGDRVDWTGAVSAAGRLFKAFDIFALSSRTEGTPIALFEAMAAEVPIVATAVGGIPDVVSGTEAILVPSGDAAALAVSLDAVVSRPVEAAERAAAATRRLQQQFNAAAWVQAYDSVYRKVVRPAVSAGGK